MGTGLGLAITKEIIEGHQGYIEAENRFESGASFLFTVPVLGTDTIFALVLNPMLQEAERDEIPLSMIRVEFWDHRSKRETMLNDASMERVKYALQKMTRSVDAVVPFQNRRVYIFSSIDKKMIKEIGERVQVKLTKGSYIPKGTEVQFRTYTYPQETASKEEFRKGCRLMLSEN